MKPFLILLLFFSTPVTFAESYRPLDHLWEGTLDIPNSQSTWILGVGAVATLGALTLDTSIKNHFQGHNRMQGTETFGNQIWGVGIASAFIGAGLITYGLLSQQDHELEAGEAHLEGVAATVIYTGMLKFTVQRNRPDSSNHQSFPSGHTSIAFSTAANLMDFYGPAVGIPALVLGAYTGICRINTNKHHLSDVVFGATLGYAVGHAYSLHHERKLEPLKKQALMIYPFFESRDEFGLQARIVLD